MWLFFSFQTHCKSSTCKIYNWIRCLKQASWHRTCTYPTHSFSRGMDVLLLLFCTMLAWFLNEIRMSEGAKRQGSPSTCMGIDLYVKSVTSRHWCSLSPWPPTWRAAWKRGGRKEKNAPQNRYLSQLIKSRMHCFDELHSICVRHSNEGQRMYFDSKI